MKRPVTTLPAPAQSTLPGLAAPAIYKVEPLSVPRHMRTNTTTRTFELAFSRLTCMLDAADRLRSPSCASLREFRAAVCALWAELEDTNSVDNGVLTKVLGFATDLGLCETLSVPDAQGRWLQVYPAGTALLTDPDPMSLMAALLCQQPASSTESRRWAVALLNFLVECEAQGIDQVHLSALALLYAPATKEGPWKQEAHTALTLSKEAALRRLVKKVVNAGSLESDLRVVLHSLFANRSLTESEAAAGMLEKHGHLFPNAKESGAKVLAGKAAPYVATDDIARAAKAIAKGLLDTTIASHIDHVRTGVRYMAAVGLVEYHPGNRVSLSEFGREVQQTAVSASRSRSYDKALAKMRATVESQFAGRTRARIERFQAFLDEDRTPEGRHALADALCWEKYAGQREYAEYESVVFRAAAAVIGPVSLDAAACLEGLRTRLSYDFHALSAAPGGGPDAAIPVGGLFYPLEASGTTGDSQLKQEMEPVTRHARARAITSGSTIPTVFVCPEFDDRMALHLLAETAADPDNPARPACPVVPVSEAQLCALLLAGADLQTVLDKAGVLAVELSQCPGWPAARRFLVTIDQLVNDAITTAAPTNQSALVLT
jgi:hypothetical protein